MIQASVETVLPSFNKLALHYQDEVFTLAYYLLGDEARAAEAAARTFESLYRPEFLFRPERFRLEALRGMLLQCRQKSGLSVGRAAGQEGWVQRLALLAQAEREAVVLVDVLSLSYDEAALVLACSRKQITRLLAQARFHLSL